MAWDLPGIPMAGTIATVAGWGIKVRDCLRYLKGLDGVPTIESGLTIDNTDGDERLLLPLLSTAECTATLNAEGEVAHDEQTHRIKMYDGSGVRSIVTTTDVDDTPIDSATTDPISSNWAFDHVAAADPHTGYVLESILTAQADLPYATGASTWAALVKGTALYYLRMNAGGTAPEWAAGSIPIATGTYTGTNADGRQITTGFICRLVIIAHTTGGGGILGMEIVIPSASFVVSSTVIGLQGINDITKTYCHAANGFVVSNINPSAFPSNDNGGTYYYLAIG